MRRGPGQPPRPQPAGHGRFAVGVLVATLLAIGAASGALALFQYADDRNHDLLVGCRIMGGHMANVDAELGKEYLTSNRHTKYTCVLP